MMFTELEMTSQFVSEEPKDLITSLIDTLTLEFSDCKTQTEKLDQLRLYNPSLYVAYLTSTA